MNKYLLSIMKGQRKGFIELLITYLLVPVSFFYRLGVFFHRNSYKLFGSYKAHKPVISVGNITVGGVGKTPLVIWLARNLNESGLKPIILMRGYMPQDLRDSDEIDMINAQLPNMVVLAGGDRVRNIKKSKDLLPVDVYLADDAFQHWPLHRDLNIVAIDTSNPFGNGHLLPAGILREGLRALKRADIFVLTKTNGSGDLQALTLKLKAINPQALMVESRYKSIGAVDVFDSETMPGDYLNDKRVAGFCAIGDPFSFELSLKNSGANVFRLFTYMDHHIYKREDVQQMVEFCRSQGIQTLVTTHKDAVKLQIFKDMFAGIRLVYIPIQLEITKGSDEFFQKVISVCRH